MRVCVLKNCNDNSRVWGFCPRHFYLFVDKQRLDERRRGFIGVRKDIDKKITFPKTSSEVVMIKDCFDGLVNPPNELKESEMSEGKVKGAEAEKVIDGKVKKFSYFWIV